jgi:hypothetical protein
MPKPIFAFSTVLNVNFVVGVELQNWIPPSRFSVPLSLENGCGKFPFSLAPSPL